MPFVCLFPVRLLLSSSLYPRECLAAKGLLGLYGRIRLVNKWCHRYAQMSKIAHYVTQPTRELFVLAEVSCDIIYLFTTAALPTWQNVQKQRNFTCHYNFVFSWCYFGYLPAFELLGLERRTSVTWWHFGKVPCEPQLHLWCSCSCWKKNNSCLQKFWYFGEYATLSSGFSGNNCRVSIRSRFQYCLVNMSRLALHARGITCMLSQSGIYCISLKAIIASIRD